MNLREMALRAARKEFDGVAFDPEGFSHRALYDAITRAFGAVDGVRDARGRRLGHRVQIVLSAFWSAWMDVPIDHVHPESHASSVLYVILVATEQYTYAHTAEHSEP